jgi:hypothetical protein
MRPLRLWVIIGTVVTITTSPMAAIELAAAQEGEGITPSFGDGRLTISGGGFRAGERVSLTVQAAGTSHQFTALADAQGRFQLATDLMLRPGTSVQIEARGDQGTTVVAITSAPGSLPVPLDPETVQPQGSDL